MSKNELKNKIITIAEEVFRENDYQDISIRDVSHLAGISVGSFYRYIGSKEELFRIFHYKLGEQIEEILSKKAPNKTGIEKIDFLFDTYINLILEHDYKFTAFFLALSLEKKEFISPPGILHSFLKDYVGEAFIHGEFNDRYNLDYIFKTLFSSIRGTVFDWCICKGNSDLKNNFKQTFNILINEFRK